MILRPARIEDIPHLPSIERSAGQAFRGSAHDWIADDVVTEAEAYPALIFAWQVWIAEVEGEPRGFVQTAHGGDAFHIQELAVHSGWQQRGIGAALVRDAAARARAAGFAAVTLTTFRDIAWNAPFYTRLGFVILDAPDARLAGLLAQEAERGLTDRCAMRLDLRSPA